MALPFSAGRNLSWDLFFIKDFKAARFSKLIFDFLISKFRRFLFEIVPNISGDVLKKINTYFTSVAPTALLLQCNWPITGIRRISLASED